LETCGARLRGRMVGCIGFVVHPYIVHPRGVAGIRSGAGQLHSSILILRRNNP
jgi:hypothetical protein